MITAMSETDKKIMSVIYKRKRNTVAKWAMAVKRLLTRENTKG